MRLFGRRNAIKMVCDSNPDAMKVLTIPHPDTGKMCVLTILPKIACKDGFIYMDAESFRKYFEQMESINKTLDMNDA